MIFFIDFLSQGFEVAIIVFQIFISIASIVIEMNCWPSCNVTLTYYWVPTRCIAYQISHLAFFRTFFSCVFFYIIISRLSLMIFLWIISLATIRFFWLPTIVTIWYCVIAHLFAKHMCTTPRPRFHHLFRSLFFSQGFTFHLHYRCIIPSASMINGKHEQLSAVHSCHCLSVCQSACQSACRSVCLSVSLSTEDWNVANVLWVRATKSCSSLVGFLLQKCAFSSQRAIEGILSSWHANSLLNEWAS